MILKLPTKVQNQMVSQVNSVEYLRVNTKTLKELTQKHFRGRPLSLRPLYPDTKTKENRQRKLMNMDTKVFDKMPPIWIYQYIKRIIHMVKWDLSQGCKDFSVSISQLVWYKYVNKLKNKNHMIFSIDAEKTFNKIQHRFMIKKKKLSRK